MKCTHYLDINLRLQLQCNITLVCTFLLDSKHKFTLQRLSTPDLDVIDEHV